MDSVWRVYEREKAITNHHYPISNFSLPQKDKGFIFYVLTTYLLHFTYLKLQNLMPLILGCL